MESLTSFPQFERTNYGTIQMMVQHWLKQLQASEENLLSETEPWKTFLEFTNVGEDLESMVRMLPTRYFFLIEFATR